LPVYHDPKKKGYVNIKMFDNGSVQMTGVKSLPGCFDALTYLLEELLKTKAIVKNFRIVEKPFLKKPNKLHLHDFKIQLINTNFKIDYPINREHLYNCLLEEHIECTYEPCTYAGINIKYTHQDGKVISILVFEKKSIIITAGTCSDHIKQAYKFIMKKLKKYGQNVILTNTGYLKTIPALKKYIVV
jgi:TATA-box binding protein (TBP) (component of TFIID and TFIIIB)